MLKKSDVAFLFFVLHQQVIFLFVFEFSLFMFYAILCDFFLRMHYLVCLTYVLFESNYISY